MRYSGRPVFFDPSAKRWRHVLRVVAIAVLGIGLVLGAVTVGVLVNPELPKLGTGSAKNPHGHRGTGNRAFTNERDVKFRNAKKDLKEYLGKSLPPVPVTTASGFERIAFYVNWDDNSWVSLKRNLGDIDTLVAEWMHLDGADGAIKPDDERKQAMALKYIRERRPDLPVVALINNFVEQRWDSAALKTMLASPAARRRTIDAIENFLHHWQLNGVSIDFEAIPKESQQHLVAFMRELHARLTPQGLSISQSVPIDDDSFAFRELADQVDYLVLMAYDENAADNEAGPIASQDWFTQGIKARLREVPAQKIVVGIGSYGYDWLQGKPSAEEISFQDALRIAAESEGDIQMDDDSGNPQFDYADDQNRPHQVWFLDAVTAFNQMKAAARMQPRGFALWRLGSEDPGVWNVFNRTMQLDASIATQLQTVHFGYDLDYEGQGEILKVAGTPQDGIRNLNYDADIGLITDDEIKKPPRGYVINRWGYDPNHVVALTFDDGPDPVWTPQILDILKSKHVPATFFLIGENAESSPDLVKRIDAEGHQIGNHTYTHPNIADVSDRRVTLELNATERLLESLIGKRTLLFRPPYAEDVEPETPDQVHPLVLTSQLGYYSVGMQIDPDDWRRPGAPEIIKRVMEQAHSGEGNVVLLHDAGGDRSQTVEALPLLIDKLRAEGYQLVRISDLLKVPPQDVMPPLKERRDVGVWLQTKGFELISAFGTGLRNLFLLGIVLGGLRFLIIFGLALYRGRRKLSPAGTGALVSIVVPAYNEEQLIERTLRTLLRSRDVDFEIIVVDDGSTDSTAHIVESVFAAEPRVTLVRQSNSGKAQALNAAIKAARYDIVVALDADTLFTESTAARLAAHFSDPLIGAVAGNAKVGNRMNLLTRWQALEYLTSQNLDRRAFESLNCITVVPGAVGAWRRSAVEAAGGFLSDTLAEDADLTMRIVRGGYRVVFEEYAHAFTEAPQTVAAFTRQRFRWMFGTLQAGWKQRRILLRPSGGLLGFVALPNVIIFQILFPLVSPIMDLTMLWTAMEALLNYLQHPAAALSSGFWHTLYYYGVFLAIDFSTALFAYLFEPDEDWRLLPWLPLQRFSYRQLMYYVAIRSFIAALRGPHVGWGRLQRYGSVQTAGATNEPQVTAESAASKPPLAHRA